MKKGPLRGTQLLLAVSFLCTSHHLDDPSRTHTHSLSPLLTFESNSSLLVTLFYLFPFQIAISP